MIGLGGVGLATACVKVSEKNRQQAKAFADWLRRSHRFAALGQLSASVAHDINNILGVISGNLQYLQRQVANMPEASKRVETLLRAVSRGSDLIASLQAFSSLDPIPGAVTDANEAIGGLKDVLQTLLSNEIAFDFYPAPGLWQTEIDASDLSSALVNLAFNARSAMPSGGRLAIETENRTVTEPGSAVGGDVLIPGDYAVISVIDDGMGMAPEVREHAIEPFFDAWPDGRGSGLGLSMVYGFVKRSRGYLCIQSQPGDGTTVRMYLPRSTDAGRTGRSP